MSHGAWYCNAMMCVHMLDAAVCPFLQHLSEQDVFKANSLGWCIEWVSGQPRLFARAVSSSHERASRSNAQHQTSIRKCRHMCK